MKKAISIFITILFVIILFFTTSANISDDTENSLEGKYISILGDSISTYNNWVPEENRIYYYGNNCDVQSVEDTWWKKLINTLDLQLCVNNSWSGSYVSTVNSSVSAGCTWRCTNLHKEDIYPDIIIIYMGINDFNNNVHLGNYDGTQDFPLNTKTFRGAYAIMLRKVKSTYPQAQIYVCTLPYANVFGTIKSDFPTNQNGASLVDYNNAISDLAELLQVNVIDFASCGITKDNMDLYLGDYKKYDSRGLHPNREGHTLLANTALEALYKQNKN